MSEQDKLQAILNLACVAMARRSTPAQREHAEGLLLALNAEHEEGYLMTQPPLVVKSWFACAKEACQNWREI